MVITAEKLSATIGEIYAAAGSPESFNHVLRRIRTLARASSAMLFTPLVDPGNGGFGFVDHFNIEFFARYRLYYWDKDPWAREGERGGVLRTANTASDESLISQHDLQKEEIYPDLLVPMDTVRLCCNILAVDDDPIIPRSYLSLYRGVGSQPFDEDDRRILDLLGPHVAQALRLSYRLGFSDVSRSTAYDVLHEVRCGVVLIDREKRVVFMNRHAEALCTGNRGLCLRAGGSSATGSTLRATRAAENDALQRTIDASLRISVPSPEPRRSRSQPVAIRGSDGSVSLIATVIPLPPDIRTRGDNGQAVVFVDDAASSRSADDHILQGLFGLTPAECRLARALVNGDPPKRIADRFALSENTIRTQIKALYAKTGTRGLASLTALLSRLAETHAAGASN
ncbi:MAG TPA: helix-turn-helix transcriptional regulator [Casimicrobiaceae bacterium]|nr:helix-turn-helix transcriptional regulator [Casimicrobiaceae bacterium]